MKNLISLSPQIQFYNNFICNLSLYLPTLYCLSSENQDDKLSRPSHHLHLHWCPHHKTMSTISASRFCHAKDEIPFKLVEVNVISAHDLPPMAKMLRTYVAARVHADHELKTPVDHKGHVNPSWNHKMVFRVDEKFLRLHSSAITFEIYNVAWLRDLPIGKARLPIQNIFNTNSTMKPLALPIRRPSGHLKGTISVTFNIVDKAAESDAKHKENNNSCQSLEEIIAAKFEPSKDLENVRDFTLMLNDDKDSRKEKTRKRFRPLSSDIVAALKEPNSVSSPEHQSFARNATFEDTWMAGVDDQGMEERIKMNSEIPVKWDDNDFLLEKDNGKQKKIRPHHNRRRHSYGRGLLSCFIKGFEFTFACGRRSSVKN